MSKTKIEWADAVWNPVTGCSKISPGCANCYAERFARRLAGRCGYPEDNPFRVSIHPERLNEPSKWHKPQRIFVCSMGDLFHPDVPVDFIRKVLLAMRNFEQHTFLLLTKRPERMREAINQALKITDYCWPLGNVWVGVSVENQQAADERVPLLLQIPAAVRFVSVEPILGPVDLTKIITYSNPSAYYGNVYVSWLDALSGKHHHNGPGGVITKKTKKLDWVICGGETGPGARPCHPDWVRGLRDQCQEAGAPFFFKQWGQWNDLSSGNWVAPRKKDTRVPWIDSYVLSHRNKINEFPDGCRVFNMGKKAAGRLLDGRTWNEYPETEVTR